MSKLLSLALVLAIFLMLAVWAHKSESLTLTIFGLTYAGFALIEILVHLQRH